MFLRSTPRKVLVLVRGPGLAASMSRYLIDRIGATPNIELHAAHATHALHGEPAGGLEAVTWRDDRTGERRGRRPIRNVFLFVGADPETEWLEGCGVACDAHGFVLTGSACGPARDGGSRRRRSSRACPACSPSATCARVR